jgi:sugar fermentation stimulation protein A
VAARSLRHLGELAERVAEGDRAAVLFVVQRADCDAFAACADLDPAFAEGLCRAADAGVAVLVYRCRLSLEGITLVAPLPWRR